MKRIFSCFLAISFLFIFSCQTTKRVESKNYPTDQASTEFNRKIAAIIVEKMQPDEKVAVIEFADKNGGDFRRLAHYCIDRTESALIEAGATVITRQGIDKAMKDSETYGDSSKSIDLEKADADVQIIGEYDISFKDNSEWLNLSIRANRKNMGLVGIVTWEEKIINDKRESLPPPLDVKLDRDSACYVPGERATITIDTQQGVFIYILGIQNDGSVVRIYPHSRYQKNQRIEKKTFIYPEDAGADKLAFFPSEDRETSHETIRVVASRTLLDFSFLSSPKYKLVKGGKMHDVELEMRKSKSLKFVDLPYKVGEDCW